jgi:peptide/nickel transport system permease protein
MGVYIIQRVLNSIPILIGITFIGFVALSMAPGDPILARIDPSMLAERGPEWLEEQRVALGLDGPIVVRYARWLWDVLQGDLGFSIVTRRPITAELALRLPATLQLMGAAVLIALLIGIPFGIISAIKRNTIIDYVLTTFTMSMISIPSFFLGLLGIYIFGVWLDILPTGDMYTIGAPPTLGDRLIHLVLPASILGFLSAAPLLRYTRASMLEVLRRDYMRTARAKGLHESIVIRRHAFRNALMPVITIVGLLLPQLVAGAVITE